MYCMIHFQNPVYYWKRRHIQAYSRPVQTYSAILWHIWNPVQFLHIQDPSIFRIVAYLELKIYSEPCQGIFWHIQLTVTLAFWKTCFIQNFAIFRIFGIEKLEVYSESCLFRHVQTYSVMITLTFFIHFFSYFSTGFKKTYAFWLQWRQFQCSIEFI